MTVLVGTSWHSLRLIDFRLLAQMVLWLVVSEWGVKLRAHYCVCTPAKYVLESRLAARIVKHGNGPQKPNYMC